MLIQGAGIIGNRLEPIDEPEQNKQQGDWIESCAEEAAGRQDGSANQPCRSAAPISPIFNKRHERFGFDLKIMDQIDKFGVAQSGKVIVHEGRRFNADWLILILHGFPMTRR